MSVSAQQKVLGVGLGRTGTQSLCAALNTLGIPSVHFPDGSSIDDLQSGAAHLMVLASSRGIANGTAMPFRLLDRTYPEAKFILTVRGTESWLRSKEEYAAWELDQWETFDPQTRLAKRRLREHVYGSFDFDADRWGAAYHDRVEEVTRYFERRPADLLTMEITAGDGWKKLCPFLGVAVPASPFPHVNSQRAVEEWSAHSASVRSEIASQVGEEEDFILVDDGCLGYMGDHARPFLEREGLFWGQPLDDESAIAELERMRGEGVGKVVFIRETFWWFETYPGFHDYLSTHFPRVAASETVVVFDLGLRRSAHRPASAGQDAAPE